MSASDTLQFENGRALQGLFANDLKLLRHLEESLRLKVTTRDGWIRMDGDAADVQKGRKVFDQLEKAQRSGVIIRAHEFQYALRSVLEGTAGLGELAEVRVVCSIKKPPVHARTAGQANYLKTIQAHDITFGIGPAGTGKTFLAMAMAVAALKKGEVTRLILTRPAVEAGEALGFLPGDLREKISPYLRPLYDALNDLLDADEAQRHIEKGIVEVAPLAYMRGRTLNQAFVILDEAQNTTTEQMLMFLTRLGAESKCVVTGDPTQVDLPKNRQSGLVEAMRALDRVEGIGFTYLDDTDVVRHPLVQKIIRAYREHRQPGSLQGRPSFTRAQGSISSSASSSDRSDTI